MALTVAQEDPSRLPSVRGLLEEIIVPRLERREVAFVLSDTASGGNATNDRVVHQELSELPARFLSPRHAHGAHEVCWVLHGCCVLAVDVRALKLTAGDACIVQPGEVHQLRPAPGLDPFETLWWHVTDGGINLSLAGFAGDRSVTRGGFVSLAPSPAPALARIVHELGGDRPRRDLLVRAILLELAAALLRHLDEVAAGSPITFTTERRSGWHVQRVAQYIKAHHGPGITLEKLARIADLSPYYLTRLFRHYTGRGVMAYLSEVRHCEALMLLCDTDLAVAEVARIVGYDDAYYFSRVFRAREGCAPLYYRRRLRSESEVKTRPQ